MKRISSLLVGPCLLLGACAGEGVGAGDDPVTLAPAAVNAAGSAADAATISPLPTDCSLKPTEAEGALLKQWFNPTFLKKSKGRTLKQLSTMPGGAMLTYYDVPAYRPGAERLVFNAQRKEKKQTTVMSSSGPVPQTVTVPYTYVVSTALDGTDPKLVAKWEVATTPTSYGFMSNDGKLLVYMAKAQASASTQVGVCGVRLDQADPQPFALTQLNHVCQASSDRSDCLDRPTLSPPVSFGSDDHLVVYAFGNLLYNIRESTRQPEYRTGFDPGYVPSPKDPVATDGEPPAFHRVRANPANPRLVMYRRAVRKSYQSLRGLYVIDLGEPVTSPAQPFIDKGGGFHPVWRPDGKAIGINRESDQAPYFAEYGLEMKNGVPKVSEKKVFTDTGIKNVFYGAYSLDGHYLALATGIDASDPNERKIFVVDRLATDAAPKKPLAVAVTNFAGEDDKHVDGQPRLGFFGPDDKGLVFSSDMGTDTPQVYTVSGAILP